MAASEDKQVRENLVAVSAAEGNHQLAEDMQVLNRWQRL